MHCSRTNRNAPFLICVLLYSVKTQTHKKQLRNNTTYRSVNTGIRLHTFVVTYIRSYALGSLYSKKTVYVSVLLEVLLKTRYVPRIQLSPGWFVLRCIAIG